jgi:tetratricopeptide (TPR) repeat protein
MSCSISSHKENKMDNRYFSREDFNNNFGKEMASSQSVYENMKKSGLIDYQYCTFDFDFHSDSKEKLDSLRQFLVDNYGYKMKEVKQVDGKWNLWGDATEFPVDSENLLYWALNLYVKGFQFDCKLAGYGAVVDTAVFPDLDSSKADYHFDQAMEAYNNQNPGLAIIHWSTVLKIDPNDPNSYYSRAIAKDELYTWKAALLDYDKAIEIAPNFVDALTNRGASRDESGDYKGAIEDYTKAIDLRPENGMAFLNRGNTKFKMGDKEGACLDWTKASELGDETAKERLNKNCK